MEVVQACSVALFKQFKAGNPAMKARWTLGVVGLPHRRCPGAGSRIGTDGRGCCLRRVIMSPGWAGYSAAPPRTHRVPPHDRQPLPLPQEHKETEKLGVWQREFAPLASPSSTAA